MSSDKGSPRRVTRHRLPQVRLPFRFGAAAVLAALLSAGESTAHETGERVCRLPQLSLSVGHEVSAATGHNPFTIHLTNRSQSCVVNGYPAISFFDRRGPLLFVVNHRGDQQVTSRPPKPVLVRPGRTAYVALQKYRCDLGNLRTADTMTLALPVGVPRGGTVVDLRSLRGRIAYCRGGRTVNVVSVSPFVPSIAAGFKRWS